VTLYCDSSALVKLYVLEPQTEEVQRQVRAASAVATSAVALVEIRAALSRQHREGRLARESLNTAKRQLIEDWSDLLVILPTDELVRTAADLAERHGLRALDGVHLASFQQLLERTDDEVEFSSFDDRLNRAARKLG
jgi:predicted nucleic acid-binding protein